MLAAALATLLPGVLWAENVDRIVASVGNVAITQRDVEKEYRFELFLQGAPPAGSPDASAGKTILTRLISQELLSEQVNSARMKSATSKAAAEETLQDVRKKFASEKAYDSALQSLGMTQEQVLERLQLYQQTLRMIDERLQPSAWPTPDEINAYYKQTFVPEYARQHGGSPPPLANVRDQIQEILVQKKMNELLGKWLEQLKSTHQVVIHAD